MIGSKVKEVRGWGRATTWGLIDQCMDFDSYPSALGATAGFEHRVYNDLSSVKARVRHGQFCLSISMNYGLLFTLYMSIFM